ncbi:hypothetical protein PYCC9005_005827 [Savitreella phatthalungensis]
MSSLAVNAVTTSRTPVAAPRPLPPVQLSPADHRCLGELRKLREAITASGREDAFAVLVFERSARYAVSRDHPEAYLPALRHLLFHLYTRKAVKPDQDLVQAYLLHLLCVMDDLHGYLQEQEQLVLSDMIDPTHTTSTQIMLVMVRGDPLSYNKILRDAASTLCVRLIEHAREKVYRRALAVTGAAYMQAPISLLDAAVDSDRWRKHAEETGWVIDGENDRVIIRAPRASRK